MAFQGRIDTDSSARLRASLRRTGLILLGIVIALMVISVLFVMSRSPKGAREGRLPAAPMMQTVGAGRWSV
jgi:hypothetical protein